MNVIERPRALKNPLKLKLPSGLDPENVPHHVAIVMDGNRRWARRNFLPAVAGHWKGAETLSNIVRSASNMGIQVLTVYALSTENWNRGLEEVSALMKIYSTYLKRERGNMVREGVRLDVIGDLTRFPQELQDLLYETKQATRHGENIDLVLALNYGARDELRRATLAIATDFAIGKLSKEDFSEQTISSYLDTSKWRDPDLLIRTSGEARLSNFMLWQISYAEIFITKTLWPDFTEKDLFESIMDFQKRHRRLGG